MLSPPKFTADLESSSLLDEKIFDVIPSEQIPCSPESYSTSVKGLFELLQQGIILIEGRQIAAGLKKLQQLLDKINLNRNTIETANCSSSQCSYWRLEFTCLYNMSYAYTLMEKDDDILKYNKKIIALMDRVEKEEKNYMEWPMAKVGGLDISCSAFIQNKAAFLNQGSNKYSLASNIFTDNGMKLQILFIRVLLYSCFKLSRIDEHEEAFMQARRAKNMITKILQSLQIDNAIENSKKNINEKIEFKNIIGKKAHPIMKQLKKDLTIDDVQKSESLKMIKSTISCWKKNPEHSKKDLKANRSNCYTNNQNTKIQTGEQRSLLGVRSMKTITNSIYASRHKKKSPQCIKDILCLEPVNFKELCRSDNIVYELIPQKLKQKIQLLCASYFCMGIELWNIETENQQEMNSLSSSRSLIQIQVKNSKQHATSEEMYKKSQLYLLKSIGITVSYLKQYENLLDNLVEVYQRKFEGEMMSITEENSRFEMSPCPSSQLKRDTKNRLSHKLLEQEREREKERENYDSNGIKTSMIKKQEPSTSNTLDLYDQYEFEQSIMGPQQVYYKLGRQQSEEEQQEFFKISKNQRKQTQRSRSKSKSKGKPKVILTCQSHSTINFSCKGKTRSRRKNIEKRHITTNNIGSKEEYHSHQFYCSTANIHPNIHNPNPNTPHCYHAELIVGKKSSKNKIGEQFDETRKSKKKSLETSKSRKKNQNGIYRKSDESSLSHSTLDRYKIYENLSSQPGYRQTSIKTLSNTNISPKHKVYEMKIQKLPYQSKNKNKPSNKKSIQTIKSKNSKLQKSQEKSKGDISRKGQKVMCSYTNVKACISPERSFDRKDLSGSKKSSKKAHRTKKPLKNL